LVDCVGASGVRLHVPLEWVAEAGDDVLLCKSCNEVRADLRACPALARTC
jgi:hypothetical protein